MYRQAQDIKRNYYGEMPEKLEFPQIFVTKAEPNDFLRLRGEPEDR